MAKGAYIGVDSVARKNKKIYVGVSGVSRKVKNGYAGISGVARQVFSAGTPITTLSVGDTVQVAENGVPVDYLVIQIGTPNSNYSNADGYWLLRKLLGGSGGYFSQNSDGDQYADYESSYAASYIRARETAFYNSYGDYLKSVILRPTLPYYYGYNAAIGTVTASVFHLGKDEIRTQTGADEKTLDYFQGTTTGTKSDGKRMAYDSGGTAHPWWLRDASGSGAYLPSYVTGGGTVAKGEVSAYDRPCFIVPKTIMIEDLLR